MDSTPCPCCGSRMGVLEEDEHKIKLVCPSCKLTDVKLKSEASR